MTTGPLAPRSLLVFPGDGESGGKIGRGCLRGVSTTGGTDREVVQPRQADRDAFVAVVAEYARARISPLPVYVKRDRRETRGGGPGTQMWVGRGKVLPDASVRRPAGEVLQILGK